MARNHANAVSSAFWVATQQVDKYGFVVKQGGSMLDETGDKGVARWYAVRTLSNQERRAQQQLLQQGFATYLPLVEKSIRHARKLRSVHAALFPGYLFINLDLFRDQWRCVNSTFGVSGLIMGGDRPMPVPRGVVEGFQELTQPNGLIDFTPDLAVGSTVKVVSGALAGMVGQLATLNARGRVEVLLKIMGQEVRVKSTTKALMPA
jgi:transcription elongation factor/antiterminator RfaH